MELGAAAAAEYRSAWLRRTLLLLLAAVTLVAGMAVLWLAGLMAIWNTGWAMTYVFGSGVLLLLVAMAACATAMSRRAAGPASTVLNTELRKDVELFQEWQSTISN